MFYFFNLINGVVMFQLNDKENIKAAKKYRLVFSLLFILLIAYVIINYGKSSKYSAGDYKLDIAKSSEVKDSIKASGKIRSKKIVLVTSQTEGTVAEVMVSEGMLVKNGDLIARMENPDKQLNLAQEKGVLSEHEVQLELLTAEHQHNKNEITADIEIMEKKVQKMNNLYLSKKELERQGILSKVALIQEELSLEDVKGQLRALRARLVNNETLYRAKLKAAKAKLMQQEILVNNAQRMVDSLLVYSPFSGTIQSLNIELGQRLSIGTNMVTLADLSSLEVRLSVLQKHLQYISDSNEVILTIGGSEQKTNIAYIESNIENGFATIVADVDSSQGWLRPAMDVDATITIGEKRRVVLVGRDAVISDGQGMFVYKTDAHSNVAKKTRVIIGREVEGTVEIIEGLQENDYFVSNAPVDEDLEVSVR